jgi:O-antigen ligase
MTYLLALLYLTFVYLRPAEIVPAWDGLPFVAVLAGVSSLCMLGSLVLRPRCFWNLPQDRFVLGFLVAIIVSNLAWGWVFGGYQAMLKMAPAAFCYFLLRSSVQSLQQLRWVGYTLIGVTLFQAVNGIVQFHTGVGLGDVTPVEMHFSSIDPVAAEHVQRIRGTGFFNDPNDLALALVIAAPFLAGPLVRPLTGIWMRILAFVLLIPIVIALYYTNSRGGVLGLGAALLPYVYRRFGRLAGPVVTVVGLVALLVLGPSRMSALDASEASAQGRVQSWAEGLQMFKSRPIFGVGFGRYTDYNDLVAHNSFVHTLGELGLVGSFCFVGMGYWFFQGLRPRVDLRASDSEAVQLRNWGDDLWRSGLGLVVCAMFLSRQYNVLLYVWLALSGCYSHVLQDMSPVAERRTVGHLRRIAAITGCAVFCTYLAVRLFASWSS